MLIKELFSEYTDNIPNPVGRGELLKICHSKDGKQMVLFAKFTQLQRFDNLDSSSVRRQRLWGWTICV